MPCQHAQRTGYNFIRIDGSGGWFADKQGAIDKMGFAGGSLVDGINNPTVDEQIYDFVEKSY